MHMCSLFVEELVLPFIVANHPYLGGTVPIFYAKLKLLRKIGTVGNFQNCAILSPNLVILTIFRGVIRGEGVRMTD